MNFLLYENFYDMVFTRHSAGKIWSSICIQDVVLHYQRIIPIQLIWLVFCIRFAWKVNLMKMIIYMFRTQRRINSIQDGLFRGCSRMMGGPPQNLSHIFYNDETWQSYTLPKEGKKIYESRDTPLEFCWHQHFSPQISKFCCIKKYRYRLFFDT